MNMCQLFCGACGTMNDECNACECPVCGMEYNTKPVYSMGYNHTPKGPPTHGGIEDVQSTGIHTPGS